MQRVYDIVLGGIEVGLEDALYSSRERISSDIIGGNINGKIAVLQKFSQVDNIANVFDAAINKVQKTGIKMNVVNDIGFQDDPEWIADIYWRYVEKDQYRSISSYGSKPRE